MTPSGVTASCMRVARSPIGGLGEVDGDALALAEGCGEADRGDESDSTSTSTRIAPATTANSDSGNDRRALARWSLLRALAQ